MRRISGIKSINVLRSIRNELITDQMLYQLSYAGPVVVLVRDYNAKRRVKEIGNRGNLGRTLPRDFVKGDSCRC